MLTKVEQQRLIRYRDEGGWSLQVSYGNPCKLRVIKFGQVGVIILTARYLGPFRESVSEAWTIWLKRVRPKAEALASPGYSEEGGRCLRTNSNRTPKEEKGAEGRRESPLA